MDPARSVKVTLPNGEFITACGFHLRVTCHTCCLDFSGSLPVAVRGFGRAPPSPQEESPPQAAAAVLRPQPRSSTTQPVAETSSSPPQQVARQREPTYKRSLPTKYTNPGFAIKELEPLEVFRPKRGRFISVENPSEMLILVDGACSANGTPDAVGGCGVVFKDGPPLRFKLENRGPDGTPYMPTSNRAELRATLAALKFRYWPGEGFKTIVIATDSAYVVKGATNWARGWLENGWRGQRGGDVKNQDLWKALLVEVEDLWNRGCRVQFWWLPRMFNKIADQAAKKAITDESEVPDRYMDICGVDV